MTGHGQVQRDRQVPRAPLPGPGVTFPRATSRSPRRELPLRPRSYGLMRQTKSLPLPRKSSATGLCRLPSAPAGRWPFPTLSLRSLRRSLDPYPAAFLWCSCPLLPRGQRPCATGNALGTRNSLCNATSTESRLSGLQSFVNLQAPTLAWPPGCTHRDSLAAGRPGRLHHASPRVVTHLGLWYRFVSDTGN